MNSLLKLLIPISLRPYLHHALNFFYGLKIYDRKSYVDLVKDKHGLEVGGPSPLFKSLLPIIKSQTVKSQIWWVFSTKL